MTLVIAIAATLGLILTNLFIAKLRFLAVVPRSAWLSAAGGASIAYVFLHTLPELARAQTTLAAYYASGWLGQLERHVYLLALVGLAMFYGLERLAIVSRRRQRQTEGQDVPSRGVFWVHIGSFALYQALIAYLLVRREELSPRVGLLFFLAMALHFLVVDHSLREHHKHLYDHIGRWLLSAALAVGMVVGAVSGLHPALVEAAAAFLAGGIVLNVIKEELPEERESRYLAFLFGVVIYALLLLLATAGEG